jgi:hypothetical protein
LAQLVLQARLELLDLVKLELLDLSEAQARLAREHKVAQAQLALEIKAQQDSKAQLEIPEQPE